MICIMVKKVMSKYDFSPSFAETGIDYSEVVTVPDQVLSMYDIYKKYAVRGDIAGLANNILPHVTDDLDDFDEAVDFVPEEDLDVLQRSRALRMAADAQASDPAHPAEEDKPSDEEGDQPSPKPQEPDADPASDEGSE